MKYKLVKKQDGTKKRIVVLGGDGKTPEEDAQAFINLLQDHLDNGGFKGYNKETKSGGNGFPIFLNDIEEDLNRSMQSGNLSEENATKIRDICKKTNVKYRSTIKIEND